MIFRDILFKPYGDVEQDGWQAVIKCQHGKVSVRYGGRHLFTTKEKPFECRYNGEVWGAQDENDVYHWVKTGEILSDKKSEVCIARRFNIPHQILGLSCNVTNDDLKRYLDEQDEIFNEE